MDLTHFYLHNVAETKDYLGGTLLLRYPTPVRLAMNDRARFVGQMQPGVEIRFVTDSPRIKVTLSATDSDTDVMVFRGSFAHSHHRFVAGSSYTMYLEDQERFHTVKDDVLNDAPFSSNVWRIMFTGSIVILHDIESYGYPCRPPTREEMPATRWLAYGSSITQGAGANIHTTCYVQHAAQRLGWDVFNCGLGGACHCENEVADYFAHRTDWDIITLELGVNMRNGFTPEEFHSRAEYMIKTLVDAHPEKPIVVITSFLNGADALKEPNTVTQNQNAFNESLRSLVKEINTPNLHLLEGSNVLNIFYGLSCDVVHPSTFGHITMGENLAAYLKPLIPIQ